MRTSAGFFRFDFSEFGAVAIWALGWSKIALAGPIHLPLWGVGAFGIVVIAGHNPLDPLTPAHFGVFSGMWTVLHGGGVVRLPPNITLYVGHPLLPWIGVMAAGFASGVVMQRERDERRERSGGWARR